MAEYQGHRSWNAWSVALTLANDEPLYTRAVELLAKYPLDRAARVMARELRGERTPEGAHYNLLCIREALRAAGL